MTWSQDSHGRTVPAGLQQKCFRRDKWTCQDCGYIGQRGAGDLNADHIVPIAEGGQDTLDNLATRCVPCHKPKTQAESARGRARRAGRRRPRLHPADTMNSENRTLIRSNISSNHRGGQGTLTYLHRSAGSHSVCLSVHCNRTSWEGGA